MDESSLSRHRSQIQLTIDLYCSDPQLYQRGVATLRRLLCEARLAIPNSPSCELDYTWQEIPRASSSNTNRTSEKVADLTKPYLPDGTKSPDDPVNWEWTTGPVDPKYPTEK